NSWEIAGNLLTRQVRFSPQLGENLSPDQCRRADFDSAIRRFESSRPSQPIPCFRDDFSSFRAKLTLTERDEETALRLPTFNEILPGELERRLDGLCR